MANENSQGNEDKMEQIEFSLFEIGILGKPKLEGKINGDVWTGFPDIKYLDHFFIRDEKLLEEYKTNLKKLKSSVIEYRTAFGIRKKRYSVEELKKQDSLKTEINRCLRDLGDYEKYKWNNKIFSVAFIRTYQNIEETNYKEVSQITPEGKKALLESVKWLADEEVIISKLRTYDEEKKMAMVDILTVKETENKIRNSKNMSRLRRLAATYFGIKRDSVSDADIDKLLDEMTKVMEIENLGAYVDNSYLGEAILQSLFYNCLYAKIREESGEKDESEIEAELETVKRFGRIEDLNEYVKENNINLNDKIVGNVQKDAIKNYIEYINLDKLFLLVMLKYLRVLNKMGINFHDIDGIEDKEDGDILETDDGKYRLLDDEAILDEIKPFKKLIEALMTLAPSFEVSVTYYDSWTNFDEEGNYEKVTRTYRDVVEGMKNFCGDVYLTEPMLDYIKSQFYLGERKEYTENDELIKKMQERGYWLDSDIRTVCACHPKLLKKFYELGLIDQEYVEELFAKIRNGEIPKVRETLEEKGWNEFYVKTVEEKVEVPDTKGFINNLLKSELRTTQDILKYYFEEKIELDDLINSDVDKEVLKKEINSKKLSTAYEEYAKAYLDLSNSPKEEDAEKLEKLKNNLDRLTKLYEAVQLSELSPEDRSKALQQFIEDSYLNLADKGERKIDAIMAVELREMHSAGMAGYEEIDGATFMPMFITEIKAKNMFSLDEAAKIREALGDERLFAVLMSIMSENILTKAQKFALIMDFFYDKNNDEKRRLLEKIGFDGELENERRRKKEKEDDVIEDDENGESKPKDDPREYTKHQYSDGIKWKFYRTIMDKDVQSITYSNGYVEFYSPRLKEHFIEKFYDFDKNGNLKGYGYGHATYIIDDATYKTFRSDFVEQTSGLSREFQEAILFQKFVEHVPKGAGRRVPHITQSVDKNWMRLMVSKFGSCYSQEEQDKLEEMLKSLENEHIILE